MRIQAIASLRLRCGIGPLTVRDAALGGAAIVVGIIAPGGVAHALLAIELFPLRDHPDG